MVSSLGGRTPFIPPGMADPSATMGSDLTGLSYGHATSVGRGTSRGRGASAGPASGTASLGADATGRGRGMAGRGAGAAGRWLVGELPKKTMECHLPVKVSFRQTKLRERKQEMWYVQNFWFYLVSMSCKLRMLAISLPLFL